MTIDEKVKRFIANEVAQVNLLNALEDNYEDLNDLDDDEIIQAILENDFVKIKSETLWESFPEMITAYWFSAPCGVIWWEEYANSETCQTQGAADSGFEISVTTEFSADLTNRKKEIISGKG